MESALPQVTLGERALLPMKRSIKTLPIVERWDCTGCGLCCRGNLVSLDDDDLEKLREQQWQEHPDFRGTRTVVRRGLLSRTYQLAQRDDGTCVFLQDDGLCQIHKEHGLEAKPLMCQTYPLQIVPLESSAVLTLRRSCPTAAADQGKPIKEYRKAAKRFGAKRGLLDKPSRPPKITPNSRRSWRDTLQVTSALERLLCDEKLPLVRRLVHGLRFCQLLQECRLRRLESDQLAELVEILEGSAQEDVGQLFRERAAPSRSAGVLFRQAAAEYLRLHPKYIVRESWSQRWRMVPVALKMARGKGTTPRLHPDLPVAPFESLERPLGHLGPGFQTPFNRYFEANIASKQYAVASKPGWAIVESFRALALTFPVAMWILRLCSTDREPTVQDAIDMVTLIDRGQGHQPLTGRSHRNRVKTLTRLAQIEQLVVWYAR